ncbi:MAG TPA: DUF6572 domain-containing protein [Chthoniobacteraceae bacterium]|jgi:hypothetical protein|nr:DUF6572 domain-containing protein [Chthoniobacteraceae bacterium]
MSLEKANVIDAMGIEESSGRLVMVIRQDEAWTGAKRQLFQLQEKLNAYLSFALDGELADTAPQFADRPLALLIESATQPDSLTLHLLGRIREQIAFQDITLDVHVRDTAKDCGPGCGCH